MVTSAFDESRIMPGTAARDQAMDAVARYNAERPASQKAVNRNIRLFLVLGALVIGGMAWLLQNLEAGKSNPPAIFVGFVVSFICIVGAAAHRELWAWAWQPATDLQRRSRNELIPHLFSFVENLRYDHGVEPEFISELPAKSIIQHTRIQYDDWIAGTHDGMPFSLCECMFWLDIGKHKKLTFQGAIFHCKAPQNFPGILVLSEKRRNFSRFWFSASDDSLLEIEIDDDRIKLLQSVRSSNPDAAKALLDGNLGNTLLWLNEAWPDGVPRLVLSQENIFLILPSNRNFFELPKIGIEVDYAAHIEPMVRELAMLLATGSLVRKAVMSEAEASETNTEKG